MRQSALITISLPQAMARASEKFARKNHMTRSELLRTALRRYFEELEFQEAIHIAHEELAAGTAKILPRRGLAKLIVEH